MLIQKTGKFTNLGPPYLVTRYIHPTALLLSSLACLARQCFLPMSWFPPHWDPVGLVVGLVLLGEVRDRDDGMTCRPGGNGLGSKGAHYKFVW